LSGELLRAWGTIRRRASGSAYRQRSPRFLALLALIALLAPDAARVSSSDAPLTLEAPSPAALDGSGVASETPFDPSEIEGADPKVADLAAHRLLEVISSREPRNETARAAQLNYLLEKLRPEIIQRAASSPAASSRDLVCAERLVDASATWVISSGVPFPRASEVIQPLLGLGPPSLRDAVKRALKALVREELKDARRRNPEAPGADGGSATYGALAGKLLDTSMTSEAFIRDACSVLWETDGKSLLGTLVHVLLLQSTAPAGSPGARVAQLCLEDLEARTAISFSSVDAWQKWWTEVKDLSVDRIIADAQARTREEYVVNWRQMLRRLRETGDRERLFLALQDTLDSANSIELRVAAVGALGDYADWVEDMRPTVNGEPIGAEDPREKLLARGVVRLVALFQGNGALGERREVYRAALTSLRQYHAFLEHNPRLLESVSQIVSDQIQQLAREPQTQDGTDTLEVIRLAGALRVASARVFVEGILAEDRPGDDGLELLAAAANCLARLLEKGVNAEAAALLMSQFKKTRLGPEKAVRELRRACVNALGVGSPIPEVRAELRAFLREVLLGSSPIPVAGSPLRGDKDLRIPAILGLGTLARQKDAGAFDALAEVLVRQSQFEPQEVVAAVDSLAYVGGEPALSALLGTLVGAHGELEKTVEEHLLKKVLSLVEAGGGATCAWVLESLEGRALEEGSRAALERVLTLGAAPQMEQLLSAEKLEASNDARLESLARAKMAVARAADALGKDDAAAAALAGLNDLLVKAPALRDKHPDLVASLAAFRSTAAARAALQNRLGKSDATEPAQVVKDLRALVALDATPSARWRTFWWVERKLAAGSGQAAERVEKIRMLWRAFLASEESRPLWEGIPAKARDRILANGAAEPGEEPPRKN